MVRQEPVAAKLEMAPRLHEPVYFLIGRAIELALKSFLLSSGYSLDDLKKIGHNLDKLAARVGESSNESVQGLVRAMLPEIGLLNVYYQAKEFEYRITGYKSYPPTKSLLPFVEALLKAVKPLAHQVWPGR